MAVHPVAPAARPARGRRADARTRSPSTSTLPPGVPVDDGRVRDDPRLGRACAPDRPASSAQVDAVVRARQRWSRSPRRRSQLDQPIDPRHRRRRTTPACLTCSSSVARALEADRRHRPRAAPAHARPTPSRSGVGDGARLTWSSACRTGTHDAVHVAPHGPPSAATRTLRALIVTLGGDVVRVSTVRRRTPARAATPSCSASTSPTPASTRSTACSSTTRQPHCRSRVDLQGRAAGRAAPTRSGSATCSSAPPPKAPTPTSSTATCVLTDGARADSVPNLEIETGEIVGAGHASGDRPLRRRAAVLPAGPRHPRGRGAPARRARLLRRPDRSRSACPSVEERLLRRIDAELDRDVDGEGAA